MSNLWPITGRYHGLFLWLGCAPVSDGRGQLILISLWVSESARVFAFAAVAALVVGLDGAPLAWLGVMTIMGISMIANWVVGGAKGDMVTLALVQAIVGLPVIYMAPTVRVIGGSSGLDLDWPIALAGGDMTAEAVGGTIMALVVAFLAWLRGASLVNSDEPESDQRSIFYTGAALLGILMLTEQVTNNDVDARFLILPFFASTLAGMAVNHLSAAGDVKRGSAFWGRFMTMAVGGILLSAITITAAAIVFNDAIRAVGNAIGFVATWVLIIVAVPFALIATGVIWFLRKLRGDGPLPRPASDGSALPVDPDDATAIVDGGASGSPVLDNVIELMRIPLAILIVLAIVFVLYITFRRYVAKRRKSFEDDRESVRGDADAGRDMAGLLGRLLPGWMRRNQKSELERRFPTDEPGISEVFQLYFSYLKAATGRGMTLKSGHTPNEVQTAMAAALPGTPVELMTERFNAACYGHEPTSAEIVGRLRSGLRSPGSKD
jgi:hypothetical protein